MRNTPLRAFAQKKKKAMNKKDERTENQKWIDKGIEDGTLPKPNTKKLLKEWKKAYFTEKFV